MLPSLGIITAFQTVEFSRCGNASLFAGNLLKKIGTLRITTKHSIQPKKNTLVFTHFHQTLSNILGFWFVCVFLRWNNREVVVFIGQSCPSTFIHLMLFNFQRYRRTPKEIEGVWKGVQQKLTFEPPEQTLLHLLHQWP